MDTLPLNSRNANTQFFSVVGWMMNSLVAALIDWQIDRLIERMTNWLMVVLFSGRDEDIWKNGWSFHQKENDAKDGHAIKCKFSLFACKRF